MARLGRRRERRLGHARRGRAPTALLDAAGFPRGPDGLRRLPDGRPWRYEVLCVSGWSDWVRASQIIARNLREVGVAATVRTYDFGAWFQRVPGRRLRHVDGLVDRGPASLPSLPLADVGNHGQAGRPGLGRQLAPLFEPRRDSALT
jgi:ABC-type transport system substrate-binding protein